MSRNVLITGAAGRLGTVLRRGLRDRFELLHLTDVRPLDPQAANEKITTGDLSDLDTAMALVRDVDAVVHTAGIPDEAPFEALMEANVRATYHVFEAARRNGVPRIVFASSAHVVGFYPRGTRVTAGSPYRPDTLYGATKLFGEGLARLYADKHGMQVACLRIGSFRPVPGDHRQLSTWLSPSDAVHLVERCLLAESMTFALVYGVSNNHRRWWHDDDAAVVGFHPTDDAENYAATIPGPDASDQWQGGVFTRPDYEGGAG